MSHLEVTDLVVSFGRHRRVAVDGISFAVERGERLGIIGQSGSGKSVTSLAVIGLLPEHAHVSGSIRLDGRELVGASARSMSRLRGDEVSMVFQEPTTALDPTMRVGRQVAEAVLLHGRVERSAARDEVLGWLGRVGIEDPARVAGSYPHELSGGQRQRVLIAMALVNRPELVICDEPTTALDVLVQRQILDLLDVELRGRAALFVSHDLGVVRRVCERVAVMLDGRIVETGTVDDVIARPRHPYTRGLIAAARIAEVPPGERLPTVADFYQGVER